MMAGFRLQVLVGVVLALLIAPRAGAGDLTFWNANGTGCYASPPAVTSFDGSTGAGIRWKTRLPNWCNGGIIAVGDRIFVMAEPSTGFAPWLLCIDAHTGKEQWRRELDPTVTMPADQREAARANATEAWRVRVAAERVAAQAHQFYLDHADQFSRSGEPAAAIAVPWQELIARLNALGYGCNNRSFFLKPSQHGSGGSIGLLGRGAAPDVMAAAQAQREREKQLAADGLQWAHWRESGTWIGIAFGTPCSDGERVYVVTGQACVFAFTLDGTPVWQHRILTPGWDELDAADRERLGPLVEKRWQPGQLAFEYATSPTLCRLAEDGPSVLLVNAGRMLRAFDAADGRARWATPLAHTMKHSSGVPRVVRIGGEPVVAGVSGGLYPGMPSENNGDALVRVRDGVVVGHLPAGAHGKGGGTGIIPLGENRALIALEARIAAESIRSDPSRLGAVSFSWAAESSLTYQVLWEINEKNAPIFSQPAVCDGTLYYKDGIVDLATGKRQTMPWSQVTQGYHDDGLLVAGNLLLKWNRYGIQDRKGPQFGTGFRASFHFFDRVSGKECGTGTLPVNPADGAEVLQRHQEEHDKGFWRWLGAAPPIVAHQRLYIRAYDFLWCIGPSDAVNQPTKE